MTCLRDIVSCLVLSVCEMHDVALDSSDRR